MRIPRLTALICTAALLLSGCTSLSLNGPDILAPPKAAGIRAELQKLIEDDAGGSYKLIDPASGSYKSGVIMHDLDHDGIDEAVALYTVSDGSPRMLTASQSGGSFRKTGSCELDSSSVSGLSFADVDANGFDELIVSCDRGSAKARMTAYFAGEELNRADIAEGFTDYVTGDFDGNLTDDIIILYPANVETAATAVLTVYSEGAFTAKSKCETDPDIAAYARLSCGLIGDDLHGAYADGVNEEGQYSTQLIYYDPASHSLINPLYVYTGYSKTLRDSKILSADADGDGATEIPLCEPMAYTKEEGLSQVCSAVQWCALDTKQMTLETKSEAVLCDSMGFVLTLKPGTTDKVTARSSDKTSMTLYTVDPKNDKTAAGRQLMTVKYYDRGEFDSSVTAEAVIYESSTGVYTCILSDDSDYTYDEVKTSFKLTEDI